MQTVLLKLQPEMSVSVEKDTRFVLDLSEKIPAKILFNFDQPGVKAEIIGYYQGNLDLCVVTCHVAPNTECLTKIRGVLHDGEVSNFNSQIIIKPTAQKTKAYLKDDVLIVGNGTKNKSEPILQIEANDVMASHGATTGRIDVNQLYYLQSRGLSREEAEKVIIAGFLNLGDIINL